MGMVLIDDDGERYEVPGRVAGPTRWLVTEAAEVVQDAGCTFKVIINLGRGDAPPRSVIERHQTIC